MQDFRKLHVWSKAHKLTLSIYRITRSFPKEEMYGLTSQLRRAASSVGANIAEGCGRNGGADLARFLDMALGSASELEYHLLLASDLELLSPADADRFSVCATEVKRMLGGLILKLRYGQNVSRGKELGKSDN